MMRGAMGERIACKMCGSGFAQYGSGRRAFCRECTARADREIAARPAVKCRECGSEFSAPSRSFRYCSDACRTEFVRRYNREYQRRYLADPEKRAVALARTRASAAARAARRGGGRPPQRQPQRPMRADPNAEPSVCGLCGSGFAPYGHTHHAYCKKCTARADREIARTLRADCKACGRAFSATNRNVRYCSAACRADGVRRSHLESRRRIESDPEKSALAAAQRRACSAARRGDAGR